LRNSRHGFLIPNGSTTANRLYSPSKRQRDNWMEAGRSERPDALLAAIGRRAGEGPAHTVFLPVWAAYATLQACRG
jgi:hypothetical protein